ncbi:hypothetical protein [Synechococcus phage S-N03]|uniref:Uncharacterized protein n=1 Tax=Synechococcus phage S-N03 TaxID=2718943 RepID=A0A6G8R5N3_9CAUD|nr:hypothetical protein PQC09_gp065 [Synechococcus phage S-N03]QIN96700.1 hypothetical protein [Synechococcus phage S-N03]
MLDTTDAKIRNLSMRNLQLMRAYRMCSWEANMSPVTRAECLRVMQVEMDAIDEQIIELIDKKHDLNYNKPIEDISKVVSDLLTF